MNRSLGWLWFLSIFAVVASASDEPGMAESALRYTTRDYRTDTSIQIGLRYSPFDLALPSKYGIGASWVRNADHSLELEALHSSIGVPFLIGDIGSISEQRLTLLSRHYFGSNSFCLSYGVAFNRFGARLGREFLAAIPGGGSVGAELIELQTLGTHLAIGNQWILGRGVTLGVDWISWTQPLFTLKREAEYLSQAAGEYRKQVDLAVGLMQYLPRFSFVKVQLGVSF